MAKKKAAPAPEPSATPSPRTDSLTDLFAVNQHSICPPKNIGGCYITKEQARSLGLTPKTEDREQMLLKRGRHYRWHLRKPI
jgi:hypothetical protein